MDIQDIIFSCNNISGISAIPIRIYLDNKCIHSFGLEHMPIDPFVLYEKIMHDEKKTLSYYCTEFSQFYGFVRHDKYFIVLGPVGNTQYSNQDRKDYAFMLGISDIEFNKLHTFMRRIPAFSLENFLHLLILLNFYFNKQKIQLHDIINLPDAKEHTLTAKEQSNQYYLHNKQPHSNRNYEKEMLSFVKLGDTTGLKAFLFNNTVGSTGLLSNEQIRQQKNMFIVSTTLISRAAMQGGMLEDDAYALSDAYIQKCESLFAIEPIMQLNYEMAMDFTQRVLDLGKESDVSPEIAAVISYIKQNISADLSCTTLASKFYLSRNTLGKKFKQETGKSLNEYIMQEKIKRAKSLLTDTQKPLNEISEYLGFSSQSYFNNIFKKHTGTTPAVFREKMVGINKQ